MAGYLTMIRGGHLNFSIEWEGVDLTEWNISVFEPSSCLEGRIDLIPGDEPSTLHGHIEWDDEIQGVNTVMSFRIQIERDGHFQSTPPIRIALL